MKPQNWHSEYAESKMEGRQVKRKQNDMKYYKRINITMYINTHEGT